MKMEVLEQIRDQYQVDPPRWTREMGAEFADEDDRWISRELIMKCVDPNLHFLPDEFYLEGLDETEEVKIGPEGRVLVFVLCLCRDSRSPGGGV